MPTKVRNYFRGSGLMTEAGSLRRIQCLVHNWFLEAKQARNHTPKSKPTLPKQVKFVRRNVS